jgi:rubrerythrin
MTQSDAVEEVLEFAVAREVEANQFYAALSEKVSNPAIRKFFEELAEEEFEHKAKLELEIIKRARVVGDRPKASDMRQAVLEKISEYMVDTGEPFDLDYEDMLLLGMKKEKASFRLYIELAEMVDEQEVHETLLCLAEEEARHKARFEIEYDKLLPKPDK